MPERPIGILPLEQEQDPKHIDMYIPDEFGVPQLAQGIYKIEGDKLVICRGQAPSGSAPDNLSAARPTMYSWLHGIGGLSPERCLSSASSIASPS